MKSIIIIRHAKAETSDFSIKDYDRPLAERGINDAIAIAARLHNDTAFQPDLIISSSANRAINTAMIFAKEFGYSEAAIQQEELIYSGSTSDYMDIISKVSDKVNSLIFVGHNPTISNLVSVLAGKNLGGLPTCALTLFELSLSSWSQINDRLDHKIVYFDFPKK